MIREFRLHAIHELGGGIHKDGHRRGQISYEVLQIGLVLVSSECWGLIWRWSGLILRRSRLSLRCGLHWHVIPGTAPSPILIVAPRVLIVVVIILVGRPIADEICLLAIVPLHALVARMRADTPEARFWSRGLDNLNCGFLPVECFAEVGHLCRESFHQFHL